MIIISRSVTMIIIIRLTTHWLVIRKSNRLIIIFSWPQPICVLSNELLKTNIVSVERKSANEVTLKFSKNVCPLPLTWKRKNTVGSESRDKLHWVANCVPSDICVVLQLMLVFATFSAAVINGVTPSIVGGVVVVL